MRKKLKISLILLPILMFFLSSQMNAESQTKNNSNTVDVVFDLAEISPGSSTEKILSEGKIDTITFLNVFLLRHQDYEIDRFFEFEEIEPLSARTFAVKDPGEHNCLDLYTALNEFKNLSDSDEKWLEQGVPEKIKKLQDLVSNCENPTEADKANINLVKKIVANSKISTKIDLKLKPGEQLIIKLRRKNKVWTFIFKYPRGKWLTYYGLCFVSKYPRKHDLYFLRESNDDSQEGYLLVAEKKPKLLDLEYIPTVFFTWMPFKRMSKSHSLGFSGGLGIDLQSPVVFAGCSLVINYNIGLNFGVVFHKQYQLKPQYYSDTETMMVDSLLSFEDLHRSVYRPSVSIGISFRFDSNPFTELN